MNKPPIDTTLYLQIRKHAYGSGRAVALTQKRPNQLQAGCILVKLAIRIPHEAFEPFEPEATIDIPVSLVQQAIQVTTNSVEIPAQAGPPDVEMLGAAVETFGDEE